MAGRRMRWRTMPTDAPRPTPGFDCRLVRVHGRVQGVGFREACVQQAQRLAVTGWVRNRRDGSVEALLLGTPEALARLQAWLHHGPPLARVERIDCTPQPPPCPAPDAFERRPTE